MCYERKSHAERSSERYFIFISLQFNKSQSDTKKYDILLPDKIEINLFRKSKRRNAVEFSVPAIR